ncbi:MAG: hypothetical protein HYU57_00215 [Micavibrio aeruginosavorus]|nr:hypothetical protein [Micavibrio aeruginosavorus]
MGSVITQGIDNKNEFSCPYRTGQLRKVFLIHASRTGSFVLRQQILADARDLQDRFLPLGLYSGSLYVIGNNCKACKACVPLRVRADGYQFSKSETRLMKRNADLTVTLKQADATLEHQTLFMKYETTRHPENTHEYPDVNTMRTYMAAHTHMLEVRNTAGKLLSVAVIDILDHGISAFQTYYDPEESIGKRSLGTFSDLKLVELAQRMKRDHVYIGAWVDGPSKLNYKKRFQNLEALTDQGWVDFDPAIHTTGPDLKKNIPPDVVWKP